MTVDWPLSLSVERVKKTLTNSVEDETMATKKGSSNGNGKWKGFYNWTPDKQEKMAIKEHLVKPAKVLDTIWDLAERGYKVSISYEAKSTACLVSVTGTTCENGNRGWTITQRHADPLVAISALHWWIAIANDFGEWPEGEANDDWLNW